MTTRPLLFDSPFLLGFDHTRTLIERAAKAAAEGYPPYNVEARDDGDVRITLAVAGFSPDQLDIHVEGNQLTVAGRRGDGAETGGNDAADGGGGVAFADVARGGDGDGHQ